MQSVKRSVGDFAVHLCEPTGPEVIAQRLRRIGAQDSNGVVQEERADTFGIAAYKRIAGRASGLHTQKACRRGVV